MASQKWVVDQSHTTVEFAVKHMMFTTVKGRFTRFEGFLVGDLDDLTTATISASIDASSVNTGTEQRDEHLRSADFFDVANHPQLTFASRSIERVQDNEYRVHGDLTMRGVTQPVTLSLSYEGSGKNPWGATVAGFVLEGKINRKHWGLNWNTALEAGGWLVDDTIRLSVQIEAILQVPVGAEQA